MKRTAKMLGIVIAGYVILALPVDATSMRARLHSSSVSCRTFELGSGTTSAYGGYVNCLREAPSRADSSSRPPSKIEPSSRAGLG